MPYWQLYYHAVWATWRREPLLTPELEPRMHELLVHKAVGLGAKVFALNGMPDHVHIVAAIPPKLSVAKFIGQVKGATSTRFNQSSLMDRPFLWQDEYAVFSLDAKRLPYHVAYVREQKRHHAEGGLIPLLERTDNQELSA